jgi:hypothetical protein
MPLALSCLLGRLLHAFRLQYNANMNMTVFCANGLRSLSLRERAGVRVLKLRKKPLTLTLSRRERG